MPWTEVLVPKLLVAQGEQGTHVYSIQDWQAH